MSDIYYFIGLFVVFLLLLAKCKRCYSFLRIYSSLNVTAMMCQSLIINKQQLFYHKCRNLYRARDVGTHLAGNRAEYNVTLRDVAI